MSAEMSRFFVAIVPPVEIQEYAEEVIRELTDRYQTSTSKAPPHITVQAPFQWEMGRSTELEVCLETFAKGHHPVPIELSGFGSFAPRVLYINVLRTPELLALQAELLAAMERQLDIIDPKAKQRPFAPHLTVASRNVNRQTFKQAWEDLKPRSPQFQFVSDRLTLLIHDGHQWQTRREFTLDSTPLLEDSKDSPT